MTTPSCSVPGVIRSEKIGPTGKQVPQFHLQCLGQDQQFLVRNTAHLGFYFCDAVFAHFPSKNFAPRGEHRLAHLSVVPPLLYLRADYILFTSHLPVLEVDAIGLSALIASDFGRFAASLNSGQASINLQSRGHAQSKTRNIEG